MKKYVMAMIIVMKKCLMNYGEKSLKVPFLIYAD